MPLSNTVIRRYTPPTCTLEVLAQSSTLSQLMGKTVLKQLNFVLSFDSPQSPAENQVSIRGDRDQLEALCDAVTSYVQDILRQTPDNFWISFSTPPDSSKVPDELAIADSSPSLLTASTKISNPFNTSIPDTKIYLEPNNYLTHNLFLGSLANPTSGSVVRLSLLQLFDLGTALDEYTADIMALPTLNRRGSGHGWPAWTSVAAVLALGVGLLPVTWQYVNQAKPKQQTIAKSDPNSAPVLAPSTPSLSFSTPQAGLTPTDNLQPLPNLAVTPPLPTSKLPAPPLTVPSGLSAPTQTVGKSQPSTTRLTQPQVTNPALSQNSPSLTPSTGGGQQIAIQPNPLLNPANTVPATADNLPKKRNLPPRLSTPSANIAPPLANLPSSQIPTESQPDPQLLQGSSNSAANASSVTTESDTLVSKLRNARGGNAASAEVATNSTLFDTPLVSEAREYFQQRWQPPSGLTETLEYSLTVAVDGTIERILPLNKAARDYVDSAGIPTIGKPFVSPSRSGKNLRIRAVLSPDGKVKVLPENE
ncbi:DUF4335 domain-containing protein [Fortiea contorta]|uniref:DUF4335 domain-containing protein n=1 Tax=Fortiea contorta TaxID=1892405 RepID=UPI000477E471|nr:DUF4335 domain-containing protein [Fortiea contorta]